MISLDLGRIRTHELGLGQTQVRFRTYSLGLRQTYSRLESRIHYYLDTEQVRIHNF